MRLLFVIDSLGSGGAQRQMVNLAVALKKRGGDVEFFVYHESSHYRKILDDNEIVVNFYRKKSRFSISPIFNLRKLVLTKKYDIVLSFLDTPNFYSEIALWGLKCKLVVSERFMYPPGRLPLSLKLLQQFHRLADFITVNSYHQSQRMQSLYPWMQGKIRTIYNGIDLDIFRPVDFNPPDFRRKLIAIGTVVEKKNLIGLAKAMVVCRDIYGFVPNILWVGKVENNFSSSDVFKRVNKILKENFISDYWVWAGECKNIPHLLAEADALIHPSFFEGLPNAICEAMACGRPVLASNVCDHSRLVKNYENGLLFDPDSPDSIAKVINDFFCLSQEAKDTMGIKSREFAQKNLSLDLFVHNYWLLFQRLQ